MEQLGLSFSRKSSRPDPGLPMGGCSRGFSVIEMMVALAVIAVGLLALAQLLGLAVQQNAFARYNTVAIEVARGKIEQLKAEFDAQLASGQSASELVVGEHGPTLVVLGDPDSSGDPPRTFSISWKVSDQGSVERQVTVEVRPLGMSRVGQEVTPTARRVSMTGHLAP